MFRIPAYLHREMIWAGGARGRPTVRHLVSVIDLIAGAAPMNTAWRRTEGGGRRAVGGDPASRRRLLGLTHSAAGGRDRATPTWVIDRPPPASAARPAERPGNAACSPALSTHAAPLLCSLPRSLHTPLRPAPSSVPLRSAFLELQLAVWKTELR